MSEANVETLRSRLRWTWILGGLVVAVLLFALSWALTGEYVSRQAVERTFVINHDFTKVRKIMVRTNAAQKIITMGGTSEFVDQKWSGGSIATESDNFGEALLKGILSADPDWQLNLEGNLKVRTLDDYVGQEVVTLRQNVQISPDFIDSRTRLVEGSERLVDYAMTTRLEREEDHTKVTLELMQEIKTHAPWFAHGIADRRVRDSAAGSLERQQAAMIKLIEDNKDQKWLLPLN